MKERQYLIGNVTEIVDGETIHMSVQRTHEGRRLGNEEQEMIRIRKLRLTDIAWISGSFTRSQIEKMLKGKQVLCLIRSREQGGKIVADVQLIH